MLKMPSPKQKEYDMDKMREEFEAWVNGETGFDCFRTNYPMTKPEDQQYMCHRTSLAWLSWQASRAALCVKLPDGSFSGLDGDSFHGFMCGVESVSASLEEAGVRYE